MTDYVTQNALRMLQGVATAPMNERPAKTPQGTLGHNAARVVANHIARVSAERDYYKAMCDAWGDSARMHRANYKQRTVIYNGAANERDALRAENTALRAERDAVAEVIAIVEMIPEAQDTTSDLYITLHCLEIAQALTDGRPTGTHLDDMPPDTPTQIRAAMAHGDD